MECYEVWDLGTGNMIGSGATQSEALLFVRALLETGDPAYDQDLALEFADEEGVRHGIADGRELAELARQVEQRDWEPSRDRSGALVPFPSLEQQIIEGLADAPVSEIAGLPGDGASAFLAALGVRTIRELATNRIVELAQAIVKLSPQVSDVQEPRVGQQSDRAVAETKPRISGAPLKLAK